MDFKNSAKHIINLGIAHVSDDDKTHGLKELSVPFPCGLLHDLKNIKLVRNTIHIDCSAEICGYWHDGSIKWLHLSFFIQPDTYGNLPARLGGHGNKSAEFQRPSALPPE